MNNLVAWVSTDRFLPAPTPFTYTNRAFVYVNSQQIIGCALAHRSWRIRCYRPNSHMEMVRQGAPYGGSLAAAGLTAAAGH